MKKTIQAIAFLICILSLFCFGYIFYWIIKYGGFPIIARTIEGVEISNFSDSERMIKSILWYSISLGIFLVIPMYIKRCFENPTIYKYYKIFWWIASLMFGTLTAQLLGVTPLTIVIFVLILLLSLAPAYYQQKK